MYGTPTDTPGGRSLKHAYTQQLDVSIGEYFTKGTGDKRDVLGQKTKVKVAKNKIAAPHKTASVDLYYAHGMDRVRETIEVAKVIGVLPGTSWLTFTDPRTGEIFMGTDDKPIKFNGTNATHEALNHDIEHNNGELYLRISNLVQDVIRGVAA